MNGALQDTIFAKASGGGEAAVAIIRIAGQDTGVVLERVAGKRPAPRMASLRHLRDPIAGEPLDQALVIWFPAPRSYTGEDCAELHLHGGRAVIADVSAALVAAGCRPAEPGEFTRRAFLHGKLDLTQAEGIADLIAAETTAQRRQALRQAEGALAVLYAGWTERAKRLLAHQEAAIEFEMDDLPNDLAGRARVAAAALSTEIAGHLDDSRRGERLREGLTVAIVGAPNAGKSSLLNALAAQDVAIVSPEPGTTRDVVQVRLRLGGVPVVLADTAGLRETRDEIEREGVRRAQAAAAEADIVIAVFAAGSEPDEPTQAVLAAKRDAVLVLSKCDLGESADHPMADRALHTSARTGRGIAELLSAVSAKAEQRAELADAPMLTRARHRAALNEAVERLTAATGAVAPEVGAEGYRGAVLALGRLTGRVGVEEILDVVFGDFCIGK